MTGSLQGVGRNWRRGRKAAAEAFYTSMRKETEETYRLGEGMDGEAGGVKETFPEEGL